MKIGTLIYVTDERLAELDLVGHNVCSIISYYPGDYDRNTRRHLAKVLEPTSGKTFVARFTAQQVLKPPRS